MLGAIPVGAGTAGREDPDERSSAACYSGEGRQRRRHVMHRMKPVPFGRGFRPVLFSAVLALSALAGIGPVRGGEPVPAASTAPTDVVGVDLSKWQGEVDFASIRAAGKHYVFVKVTQGAGAVDPDYARNISGARAAGLYAGSYHFYDTGLTAQVQFANLSRHLDLKPGDLPPVVDIEVLSRNNLPELAAELKTFLDLIERRYKVKPIVYSGESFANEHLVGFADYPLWLAEYTGAASPKLPLDWNAWTFWQHSQSGRVDGVAGAVDLDRFNGDLDALKALLVD